MIRDLHVRNLAVVAEASVEFGPGLNVLTGETGAGKSLVVDSLALLAGARASSDLVRRGAGVLTVGGVFEPTGGSWREVLEEAGLEDEDEDRLLIRREISRSGRNRVFVNDRPATVRLLSQLAPSILRIHAQREELELISPELQRRWLDRSALEDGEPLLRRTADLYRDYSEMARRLSRSQAEERLRLERIDLLRFQSDEIDAARPRAGEEEELRRERLLLRHGEAIGEALGGALGLVFDDDGAATERLARSRKLLAGIAEWEPEAGAWVAELDELRIRLEEVARGLRDRADSLEADPARLDAVEERLALLERLFRKYGASGAEVLAYRQAIGEELGDLVADDEEREALAAKMQAALAAYREAALELSAARRTWGDRLESRIRTELEDLAMGKARFAVRLERREQEGSPLVVDGRPIEHSAAGIDVVTFELAANPGEAMEPLARVASGGELSRVYLALQLAARDDGADRPALVFDEVDAGVGGAEAAALGRKLQRLSKAGQILAVTHLPQVASCADVHHKVEKRVAGGRTRMGVRRLDARGRVEEVARMLAGRKVTDLSRSHAEELIAVSGRVRR